MSREKSIVKGARVWHPRFGFGTIGLLSDTRSVYVRFDKKEFSSWVEIGHIMLEKDVLEDRKKEKQVLLCDIG